MMKTLLTIIIGIVLNVPSSHGGEEWTKTVFTKDSKNHYYVGISDGRENLNDAMDEAYMNAITEALRHNFGSRGKMSQSISSELKDVHFQNNSQLDYKAVDLEGIEPFREHVEKNKQKYIVYRMIKYPINAIKKQKFILKQGLRTKANTYGNKNAKGAILIETKPVDAQAYLSSKNSNYQVTGSTNALFHLPLGRYELSLVKDGHEPVKREVLVSGKNSHIQIFIKPSMGTLNITTHPENASVFINGRLLKQKQNLKLKSTKTYKVRYEHPDYFSKTEEISLWNKETLNLHKKLKAKPSKVKFIVRPSSAKIYLNGRKTQSKEVELTEGVHNFTIKNKGFKPKAIKVNAKANRTMPPITVVMEKQNSERQEPKENNYYKNKKVFSFHYEPIILRGENESFTLAPLGLQFFPYKWLGFSFDYRFHNETTYKDGMNYAKESIHTILGSRLYLLRNKNFHLGIGADFHNHTTKEGSTYGSGAIKNPERAKNKGWGLGAEFQYNYHRSETGVDYGIVINAREYKFKGRDHKLVTLGVTFDF